jgi:hypothetical protein
VYPWFSIDESEDPFLAGLNEYGNIQEPIHQFMKNGGVNKNGQVSNSGYCDHGMFGMDCVGFLWQTAKAAGLNDFVNYHSLTHSRYPGEVASPKRGPDTGLGNPDFWDCLIGALLGNKGLKVAKDVGNDGLPEPGDILVWSGANAHVGLVVRSGDTVAVAHSIGNGFNFTCSQYKRDSDPSKPWHSQNDTNGRYVNGPVISPYDAEYGILGSTEDGGEEGQVHKGKETNRIRFVEPANLNATLRWGESPSDLDSHLIGPADDNGTSKFHVWFSNRVDENAWLDVDDTTSYGPEIIEIFFFRPGLYEYWVHHYGGYGSLSASDAVVTLSTTPGMISNVDQSMQFHVQPQDDGRYWHVFNIRVDESLNAILEIVDELYAYGPNLDGVKTWNAGLRSGSANGKKMVTIQ